MDNLIGRCHTMSNFFSVACRRWANVRPPVKKPLGQRRQPSSGRQMCRRWPNVSMLSENTHLGPVVAAQQVLDPSHQTAHPPITCVKNQDFKLWIKLCLRSPLRDFLLHFSHILPYNLKVVIPMSLKI